MLPTLIKKNAGRWLWIFPSLLAVFFSAQARGDTTGLLIQILPPGSVVELTGPQHTVSESPNLIPRPLTGWYKLRASYPGYESWGDEVYIDVTSPEGIRATLSRKTRLKAGLRALVFPGWGHYYAGRKARGAVMTLVALGAAGGYLYLDNRADKRVSDYEALLHRFQVATSTAEQQRLKPLVDDARRVAYDAETDRKNWGWAAVAFYGYQILDAVLFFPEPPEVSLGGARFGLHPGRDGRPLLGAAYDF